MTVHRKTGPEHYSQAWWVQLLLVMNISIVSAHVLEKESHYYLFSNFTLSLFNTDFLFILFLLFFWSLWLPWRCLFPFLPKWSFYSLWQSFQSVFSTQYLLCLPLWYSQRKTCQVLLVESQNVEQKRSSEGVLSKPTVFRGGNLHVRYFPLLTSVLLFRLCSLLEETSSVISPVPQSRWPGAARLSCRVWKWQRLATEKACEVCFPSLLPPSLSICPSSAQGCGEWPTEDEHIYTSDLVFVFLLIFSWGFFCYSAGSRFLLLESSAHHPVFYTCFKDS